MSLIVQKFGGTSVGSVERIQHVADKVIKYCKAGHQVVVTVSAMSGETNRLLGLAGEINPRPSGPELDVLLSAGEQVTIALLSMALAEKGCPARSMTGWQVPIVTDSAHNKARIESIDGDRIKSELNEGKVVIVAGFQGVNETNDITTLGRGGSDTTAVALAAALGANECQIYTDVDGVYTTDPRIEPNARKLDTLTFDEMLELSSSGSKVLQIRSVEFASKYNIPIRVLSSFEEGDGTLITSESGDKMEKALISGVASNKDEAQLTIIGVPDTPGVASDIIGPVSDANIEIDMIVQNIADDGTTDFTFTVHRNDYTSALDILNIAAKKFGAKSISGNDKIVKISVVGVGMRSHAGIASKMFAALAKEQINILMISTSEIKISVVVDEKYLELGVRCLHRAFELDGK